MAITRGYTLAKNVSAVGSYPSVKGQSIAGGYFALVIMAGVFPTTATLELLGQDGATWIPAAVPTVNSALAYWLPSGAYRFTLTGGAPAGVYCDLVSLPSL